MIGRALVVAAGLAFAGSFAGDLHPMGDSLAVFRPVIFVGTVLMCAVVWRWRVAQGIGVFAAVVTAFHFATGAIAAPPAVVNYVHYQKNLLFKPADRTAFVADVIASGADVVTLQEVSRANLPVLEALRPDYPHQFLCPARGIAVLSRRPLMQERCSETIGFASALTQVQGRDVQVYSVHLFWPWPLGQWEQVADLTREMEAAPASLSVVGGDFNMVPWARSVAWIERASGTERIGAAVTTFEIFGYPLAIDHVLATGGAGQIAQRGKLGADHYGVVAQVALP